MKKYILIFLITYWRTVSLGQVSPVVKEIKIGDHPPDIVISKLINYPLQTLKLSDFKDKLLILDFWATWCGSCISKFPEEERLQAKYKDQLQILLVDAKNSHDSKQKIDSFFLVHHTEYHLPTVFDDQILAALFPHQALPHYVWINRGEVAAISGADELSEKNIVGLLNHAAADMRVKKDLVRDNNKPIFVTDREGAPYDYLFRSVLTGYYEGMKNSSGVSYTEGRLANRVYLINMSRLVLYLQAYPQYRGYPKNRVTYEVQHPEDFSADDGTYEWKKKHLFIYESTFPPRPLEQAQAFMQEDLLRYFPYRMSVRDSLMETLVIRSFKRKVPAPDSANAPSTNIYDKNAAAKFIRNLPLVMLVSRLNDIQQRPVIDESGFSGNIDISLPADLKDIAAVKQKLEDQGFAVSIEKRKIPYLVVSDHPSQTTATQ